LNLKSEDAFYQTTSDNQTLILKQITNSTSGRFTCTAQNIYGSADKDFDIRIIGKFTDKPWKDS